MLSLEEQIIDATTEEGQAQLKRLEDQEKMESEATGPVSTADVRMGPAPDPE
jgi:hypothetical protein